VPVATVIGYTPAKEDAAADVVRLGVPLTTEGESPWTKPVMTAVNAGGAEPGTEVALFAVTVNTALLTVWVCDWAGAAL
jgi:hypothetical protein